MVRVKPLLSLSAVAMSFVLNAPPVLAQSAVLEPIEDGEPSPAASPVSPEPGTPDFVPATPQQLYERVRRGVVAIQRNGMPAAVGTVLSGDGRILTALSGLAGAPGADVRYADGTTVHAKVERTDPALDLALLIPEPNRWRDGLSASEVSPAGQDIRAMLPVGGAHLGPAAAVLRGRADAHARNGDALLPMLSVDVQGPLVAGAPLLDAMGRVVAVLVRECRGAATTGPASSSAKSCAAVVVGAPVSAIRSFLAPLASAEPPVAAAAPAPAPSPSPAPAAAAAPWLGVRVEVASGAVQGVRVSAVAPSSPAESAGLTASRDVIVAVDGQPIAEPAALGTAIAKHAPGDTVKLLVLGDGVFREVPVVLRAAR